MKNTTLPDLDKIIDMTINAVEDGQKEILSIYEHTRSECERLQSELDATKEHVRKTILEVERLEKLEKSARHHLLVVSRDIDVYTEEDIKEAYDYTRDVQLKLYLERERETHLREKRHDLELNYIAINKILNQSQNVSLQMGVAISFLRGNIDDTTLELADEEQKYFLAGRIIASLEEERSHVAREIHDGAAQNLANVIIHAEICERLMEEEPCEALGEIRELKNLVRGSLAELRTIIFNLRPPALDDLGLEAVMQSYCLNFQETTGIFSEFKVIGDPKRVETHAEVTLFRIIQEALNNIRKHSKAKNVLIRYEVTDDTATMVISDDGIGFVKDEVVSQLSEKGRFGLINIRERVELLNGKTILETVLGGGTTLKISFPLKSK